MALAPGQRHHDDSADFAETLSLTRSRTRSLLTAALCLSVAVLVGGCPGGPGQDSALDSALKGTAQQPKGYEAGDIIPLPSPIDLLLPTRIRIHPFTGIRQLSEKSNDMGLDVRVEALDAYEDTTKAYGSFRFELYNHIPNEVDPKGGQLATWEVPLTNPKINISHWRKIDRNYQFKLRWGHGLGVGQRYVLVVVFASSYTERLFAQYVFTTGKQNLLEGE